MSRSPNLLLRWAALFFLCLSVSPGHSQSDGRNQRVAITHVTVIDPDNSTFSSDMTVLIEGNKIVRVEKAGRTPLTLQKESRGIRTSALDGRGKFLIPGLWAMHEHLQDSEKPAREFNMYIANGVLGIRNMGDVPKNIFTWRRQVSAGQLLGPHIVACGPIVDGPKPTNPPISISVHGADDARNTVRSLKSMGADCVKVHDGVPRDAYFAIADEAKKLKLPLAGHIPVQVRVLEATNAGQRSIEHQIGLWGTSTVEDEIIEREDETEVFAEAMRTKNFRMIPEHIAKKGNYILDHFRADRAQRLYRVLARNGTYLTPTLVTTRSLTFVDDISKKEDPRAKYIPDAVREWWKPENGMLTRYRTPAYIAYRKREYAKTLQQIAVQQKAGVSFLAGTDTTLPFIYPGFSLHDELELFVAAGFTPMQSLRTATTNPIRFLGLQNSTGSIKPGKRADLVLLEADPLKDISNTRKISAVVVRGRVLRRADLDALLAEAAALAR